MRTHGTLTQWNDERGFGFVTTPQGEEIFVHVSAFPRDGTRPRSNELVSFEVEVRADGRKRATHVQRPGSLPAGSRGSRPEPSRTSGNWLRATLGALAVAAIGAYAYSNQTPGRSAVTTPAPVPGVASSHPAPPAPRFTCDGRTHCSQMTSCAEAEFFLQNCPGTEMDGNGDGEPCERQWCN
jgi:cold shock CspA family protein